jgi:hypothetical protein
MLTGLRSDVLLRSIAMRIAEIAKAAGRLKRTRLDQSL